MDQKGNQSNQDNQNLQKNLLVQGEVIIILKTNQERAQFKLFKNKIQVSYSQKVRIIDFEDRLRFKWKTYVPDKTNKNNFIFKGFTIEKYKKPLVANEEGSYNDHIEKQQLLEVQFIKNTCVAEEIYQQIKSSIIQVNFHDHYTPKKKIGKGNFASVYLAEHKKTGQNYAVKAFLKEKLHEELKGYDCFYNEINVLKELDHQHIMKLYECWESENSYYFILNLCPYGTLTEQISSAKKYKKQKDAFRKNKSVNIDNQSLKSTGHPIQQNSTNTLNTNKIENQVKEKVENVPFLLNINHVKLIMVQLLQAIEHTYLKGIMHRDLKPDNIMMRQKYKPDCIIADFGLGTCQNVKQYVYPKCGTPGYVSPEVINLKLEKDELKNVKYDQICDVFSLGATFYFILTLKQLFMGSDTKETIKLNKNCKIDYNSVEFQKLNKQAIDLLQKMLELDPKKRIKPTDALKHPFLKSVFDEIEQEKQEKIKQEQEKIKQKQLELNQFMERDEEITEDESSHGIHYKLKHLNKIQYSTKNINRKTENSPLSKTQSIQSNNFNRSRSQNNMLNSNHTLKYQQNSLNFDLDKSSNCLTYVSLNSNNTVQSSYWQQNSLVIGNKAAKYSKYRMYSIEDKMDTNTAHYLDDREPYKLYPPNKQGKGSVRNPVEEAIYQAQINEHQKNQQSKNQTQSINCVMLSIDDNQKKQIKLSVTSPMPDFFPEQEDDYEDGQNNDQKSTQLSMVLDDEPQIQPQHIFSTKFIKGMNKNQN